MEQLESIGWYLIAGWAKTCPECGVPRGGTPGYYWHLIRDNTDDEARVQEIHGGDDARDEGAARRLAPEEEGYGDAGED